ncbi:MAG TPA: hypothetical protein VIY56_03860, partial [Vicinamibacterales bacterium]
MSTHVQRMWAFAAIAVVALGATAWYTATAMRRGARPADAPSSIAGPPALGEPPAKPYLMVRSTASDATWRRLVLVPMATPAGPGFVT